MKQMFDVTAQTIHNEDEIYCLDKVVCQKNSGTQLSLINDPVISLQSTKVYVFSDSVLCLGKVLQHPECNEVWKGRVAGVRAERNYRDFEDVKGESAEFEWNIFPGFTSLQLCDRISNLLSSLGQSPKTFTGRILLMSMFNDISCDRHDNKVECLKNAEFVKTFAKRFGIGQWSFIGPGSEKKWCPSENSPQGAWDHVAEDMSLKFAENGHPIFRAKTPLSRGKLKSKGKGKVSIHFSADQDTVDTIYRIFYVQQRPEASGPRPGGARFSGVGTEAILSGLRRFTVRSKLLAALGPEDSSAKTELEGALKRAKTQESTPTRVDPDARVGATRDRVARLEQAISAMGNSQGPEMDVLVASLKKAQRDAPRADAEVWRLEESQKRLEELRAMVLVQPVAPQPVDASAEVSRLQQMVLDLQRLLQGLWHRWSSLHSEAERGRIAFPPRSRRFWSGWGRPTGRHEHGAHGWKSCGSRTHLWIDHRCCQKPPSHRGAAIHGVQHGEMMVSRRSSRCGLRGVRVGEASNPGPQLSPSVELLDAMQEDLEGTQVRRTRRRVISDDDVPVTEVVSAAVPSFMTSRRLVLVLGGSRRFSSFRSGREFDNERPTDEASTGDGLVLTSSTVAASSGAVREVNEGRRRLVLMSRDTQEMEREHMRPIPENDEDQDSESDTISIGGVSAAGEDAREEPTAPESPIRLCPRGRQEAFASLDVVELKSVFSRRAHLLRTIPFILKGAFRSALRTTLDEVIAGRDQGNESRMTRGWKLFMFLPRLLLHGPARGGMVPRKKLERVSCFQEGMWLRLLEESQSCEAQAHQASSRRRRNQVDSLEKRANRALSLVQVGELSAARVALEGAEVAPGTLATLRVNNPERRPPRARQELSSEPEVPFDLDADEFLICLRTARCGAAGGPSGKSEHLFPILDNAHDSEALARVATLMARGEVPAEALEGIRLEDSLR